MTEKEITTGYLIEYWNNGNKKMERHSKDGKFHGVYTGWHEDGTMDYQHHWKDGIQVGTSTLWNTDGTKEWEGQYKDGLLVKILR